MTDGTLKEKIWTGLEEQGWWAGLKVKGGALNENASMQEDASGRKSSTVEDMKVRYLGKESYREDRVRLFSVYHRGR